MRNLSFLILIVFFFSVVLLLINGGCSSVTTSYRYYYPDWTPDGRIVCIKNKVVSTTGTGVIGGSGGSETNIYYITVMDADGTNEQDIKTINQVGKVMASPVNNYYAFSDGNNIKVISTSGSDVSSIDCGAEVYDFDWNPSASKLIYNAYSAGVLNEVAIIDINGQNKTIISLTGSSPTWRYGNNIIFDNPIANELFRVVALDSSSLSENEQFSNIQGGEFNISSNNLNEVYYRSANSGGIKKFNISSPEALPDLIINRNDIWNIKLSPNGQKICGTGNGAGLSLGKEIWIINIDGTGLQQIK
ncbi:hypothetical protein ACFL52_05175 [Candidatus Margulisiibacteriota bacterium]